MVLDMLTAHVSLWTKELGNIKLREEFRIDTTPGPAVHSQPYRAGQAEREAIRQEVERMLSLGVISPSASDWSSPVVLVPKPDGSTRFFIDYSRLNARTVRDVYPLPRLDDAIDSIGDASWFTILDARSGFGK
jgi:hypothetical protein